MELCAARSSLSDSDGVRQAVYSQLHIGRVMRSLIRLSFAFIQFLIHKFYSYFRPVHRAASAFLLILCNSALFNHIKILILGGERSLFHHRGVCLNFVELSSSSIAECAQPTWRIVQDNLADFRSASSSKRSSDSERIPNPDSKVERSAPKSLADPLRSPRTERERERERESWDRRRSR